MNNPFNTPIKVALAMAGVILLLMIAFVGFTTLRDQQHQARIVELQNQVAQRDKTIEMQNGVFQKLTLQAKDLTKLLDEKDIELTALRDQLKKQGAELLTATTLVVKLKKDLESAGNVKPPLPTEGPGMRTVEFDSGKDFEPFVVTGYTTVNCDKPSERSARLLLSQRTPLKFSVVVSQDKDGTWRSTATSSSDKIGIDIALAAVNPYLLEEKWYERIGFSADLGVAATPGLLGGLGASYEVGKFEVGPKVWFTATPQGINPFFGASLTWHPFKKVR